MAVSLKETTELLSRDVVKVLLTDKMFSVPVTLVELVSVIAFCDLMNENALKKIATEETPYYGPLNLNPKNWH